MKLAIVRVSTIIPAFNSARTLGEAIDSALAQDFDGHEVIVVNDGSTDGTASILAGYGDRIRVINQANDGVVAARNAGAAIARGTYLAFLDADDNWLPGRLALTCGALERNPAAALSFADMIPIDREGRRGAPWAVGKAPSLNDLLTHGLGSGIYPSAVTMRKSVFDACGGFHRAFAGGMGMQDRWLWMLARELGEFEYVAQPLVIYRTSDFAIIGEKYRPGVRPLMRLMRERYGRAVARRYWTGLSLVFASSLCARAAAERRRGHRGAAARAVLAAARFNPRFTLRTLLRAVRGANPAAAEDSERAPEAS
jgi:glycosyltransferase involved in cell wall biosynthesis